MEGKRRRHDEGTDITDGLANRHDAVQRQEDAPVDQGIEDADVDAGGKISEQHTQGHVIDSAAEKIGPTDTDRGASPRTTKHQRGMGSTVSPRRPSVYCQE